MAVTSSEADPERVLGRLAATVSALPGTLIAAGRGDTGYLLGEHRYVRLLADHDRNGRVERWIQARCGKGAPR